jgi:excisionase family DNA binding protein
VFAPFAAYLLSTGTVYGDASLATFREIGGDTMTEPRQTLTVEETANLLGISRGLAFQAVRRGDIPSIRIGRRILVPFARLQALLDGDGENPAALPVDGLRRGSR